MPDLDKPIEAVAAKVAEWMVDWVFDTIKAAFHPAPKEVTVAACAAKYFDRLNSQIGTIQILLAPHPVNVVDVYVSAKVVSKKHFLKISDAADLQRAFEETHHRDFTFDAPRQDAVSLVNEHQYLLVLGEPGIGKSTFLKRIACEAIKPTKGFALSTRLIPAFIDMKDYKTIEPVAGDGRGSSFIKTAILRQFQTAGFPDAIGTLEALLNQGNMILLLDALDEIPDKYVNDAIEDVKSFRAIYSKNHFIISARLSFYTTTYIQGFTEVVMASFDDRQIGDFVANWFRHAAKDDGSRSAKFVEKLFEPSSAMTLELARTPLLLTFLCISYDASEAFPTSRAILYERALQVLLERWEAEKRLDREKISDFIKPELELIMLKEIASHSFEKNKIFFEAREIDAEIYSFLQGNLRAPADISATDLRNEIVKRQGLFAQRSPLVFTFSHLTFQEYLAASHFLEKGKVPEIIREKLFEPRWREVLLLIMGKTSNEEHFSLMNQVVVDFLRRHEDSLLVVRWASSTAAFVSGDNTSNAARRIFATQVCLWLLGGTEGARLATTCSEIGAALNRTLVNSDVKGAFDRLKALWNATAESDEAFCFDVAFFFIETVERENLLSSGIIASFRDSLKKQPRGRPRGSNWNPGTSIRNILLSSFDSEVWNAYWDGPLASKRWSDLRDYLWAVKLLTDCCNFASSLKHSVYDEITESICRWQNR